MIEKTKIEGRDALVAYMTDDFKPTSREKATLLKIVFEDGIRFARRATETKDHNECHEPAGSPEGGQFAEGPCAGSGESDEERWARHDAEMKAKAEESIAAGAYDHPLSRPQGYAAWGSSHGNSNAITAASATMMGIPGFKPEYQLGGTTQEKVAMSFLSDIASSPGSSEPLYHGFANFKGVAHNVGETIRLPLTAASGAIVDAVGYGMRGPSDKGLTTVYEFPKGVKMAGYSRWSKSDAVDFGHAWSEAIVAGEFEVVGVRTGTESYAYDKPEYKIVTLKPVRTFDPTTGQWL